MDVSPMEASESQLKLKDAARAAALLLEAVDSAPERALSTVETAFGRAEVALDEEGADVVLREGDATVHVRWNEGEADPAPAPQNPI
jgi:hypothetical protein